MEAEVKQRVRPNDPLHCTDGVETVEVYYKGVFFEKGEEGEVSRKAVGKSVVDPDLFFGVEKRTDKTMVCFGWEEVNFGATLEHWREMKRGRVPPARVTGARVKKEEGVYSDDGDSDGGEEDREEEEEEEKKGEKKGKAAKPAGLAVRVKWPRDFFKEVMIEVEKKKVTAEVMHCRHNKEGRVVLVVKREGANGEGVLETGKRGWGRGWW